MCKYFGVTTVQEAKEFVDNVKIIWWNGDLITTKQEFIATAKACKYACNWCFYFYTEQSFLDSLTAEDWNLSFSNVSEDKVCVFEPDGECIVIRNSNKVFVKEDFDQEWFDSILW